MVAVASPPQTTQLEIPSRYRQLAIYDYILEARKPTLKELCDQIPTNDVPKIKNRHRPKGSLRKHYRQYPKDWSEISRRIKEKRNYTCQVCGLQCLRPEDSKDNLTKSQIAKLTANVHHVNGDSMLNLESNLLLLCSTHHLEIHRGRRSNPPQGQTHLFDLASMGNSLIKKK